MRKLILISIVLLALFLRLYKVNEVPPALNWDEVSIGYNAYSILKTGRDEWGKLLPLHFLSYGEYKLPVQIYASIPAVAIFGLNEWGVRITPAVYGTLTVLLLYFLARDLFKNKNVGVLSAFFLAISPWHIHLTRASFESSFSVFWVTLAVWLMVLGLKNRKYLMLSAIPFAIAVYTYNSARVFVPLFLFVLLLFYRKDFLKVKKATMVAALLFVFALTPLIPFSISGEVANRYKLVSIVDEPGLIPRINERRGLSTLPEPLPRLIHNKVTYLSFYFVSNYLAHFSPDFLFVGGAPHKQHHVQGVGEMYLVQAPLVVLGLYFLFKKKEKFRWLVIAWIFVTFIPVAITRDSIPHALRTVLAVVPYSIISAYGAYNLFVVIKNKSLRNIVFGVLSLVLIFNFSSYINNYYSNYPVLYSRDWQYGYKEVVEYIKQNQDKYDQIVFSRHYGEPHMFTLFYLNWDPDKFMNDPNLERFESFDWIRVLHFNKFYFPDLGDEGTRFSDIVDFNKGKKIMFIGKPGDFPESIKKLLEVKFKDGKGAFEIVEVGI